MKKTVYLARAVSPNVSEIIRLRRLISLYTIKMHTPDQMKTHNSIFGRKRIQALKIYALLCFY